MNDPIALQFAQMLRQHFLCHTWDELPQLTEAVGATLKLKQDQWFPLAADDVGSQFYRAVVFVH